MKILKWFAGSCFIAICVIFAISNRDVIVIQFWPLQQVVTAQLGIVIILPTFAAFLLGCLWMSVSKATLWQRARNAEKRAAYLKCTLEELEVAGNKNGVQPPMVTKSAIKSPLPRPPTR